MCLCVCVCALTAARASGRQELASVYVAEASLYFRQVFPLFCSTFSHSLEFAWMMWKCSLGDRRSEFPFHALGIHLALTVQLYESEDMVYTHALTGGLGLSPRSEGFIHFGAAQSFLLSVLAGGSCAGVVDPPWLCYERQPRWRDGKQKNHATARSRFSKLRCTVRAREKKKKGRVPPPHPLPPPSLPPFPCLTTASVPDLLLAAFLSDGQTC